MPLTEEDKKEKRKYERKPYDAELEYFRAGKSENMLPAVSIDISEGGIGLTSDCPLEPGQVIIFKSKENPSILKIAIVQWSMKVSEKYRAGLMFI
ncbi:MAG: PilZ domain-containing protein [Nitrospirota bacterium]